ncbi:hypothetical protein JG688_00005095 [Phytophthora aleatoria]|uniref:Uncharacterized protein n=1 Tax=Phytophthora aleatoria TaxID=2496075 RepID=A0A8J5JD94_9STRA|nr:hypothetical protein JG688_00005095 [Phytophthora aleatoria]
MTMSGTVPPELDGWVIVHSNNSSQITAYGLTPRRAQQFFIEKQCANRTSLEQCYS